MGEPDRDVRVCFVGDSFVAGVGDSSGLGWVGRVAVAAARQGLQLTSYNLGVRGETSVQIAARLPGEVVPRLVPASDPRIVLSFGVNDTTEVDGRTSAAPGEAARSLHEIYARVAPVGLLLAGPPAVSDQVQNRRILQISETLREAGAALGIAFVDCFTTTVSSDVWQREVRDGDGYHPDAAGYGVLASILTGPILDWLRKPTPGPKAARALIAGPPIPAGT